MPIDCERLIAETNDRHKYCIQDTSSEGKGITQVWIAVAVKRTDTNLTAKKKTTLMSRGTHIIVFKKIYNMVRAIFVLYIM